jgi:hypothetical protein
MAARIRASLLLINQQASRGGDPHPLTVAPERLSALRRVATIESIGSSTRIEGSKLTDREVERLLSNLEIKSFASRDEQEVAGYAETMDLAFRLWKEITITENHIEQLYRDLLVHCEKDERHRGSYKTGPNNVVAFGQDGKQIGIVLETAMPFDTPLLMTELYSGSQRRVRQPREPIFVSNNFSGSKRWR